MLRNYLLLVFKEINLGLILKPCFWDFLPRKGIFFVQLCSAYRGHLRLLQIQLFRVAMKYYITSGMSRGKWKKSPESGMRPCRGPGELHYLGRCWVPLPGEGY